MQKKYLISPFIFLLFCIQADGSRLTGRITDEKQIPIPFVNIYITGTSIGTTANIDGDYFLDLKSGVYDISIRMIGFKLEHRKVIIGETDVKLDIQMVPESFNLREVTVKANAEDPAYRIIREAQKKRKYYKENVNDFSSNAYVKSTQRLLSYPKRFMGSEVDLSEFVDTVSGIFYLSESVSNLFYKKPEKYKEKMISSKVSGSARTYSFNQASDVLIDLYDNLVKIGELTPRGIVSPISSNAMFFYTYRLESTYIENGLHINKISVIPKRASDPVFTGTVYITDDSWRIYSADLFITGSQQMEFIDTFRIRQNFILLEKDLWLPFSHQLSYSFNVFGFRGNGIVTGIFSDYDLKPDFAKSFFGNELLSIDASANKKDSSYWSDVRPAPLTLDEQSDYKRKDSTRVIRESKPYRDSVDRKNNKFTGGALISGYSHENSFANTTWTISSPLQQIFFNTVEGWNARMYYSYKKEFGEDDRREYTIKPSLRYGFSNGHLNGGLEADYLYNTHKLARVNLEAGKAVMQFNDKEPISDMTNSIYSLWAEKNFMKLYEKKFISIGHKSELLNGLGLGVKMEYADRHSLVNSTSIKFVNDPSRKYLSNDPYYLSSDSLRFKEHKAFILDATLVIRLNQQYISRPEGKYNVGSKYPSLRLNYRKGMQALGSAVDFDFYKLSISDNVNLGLIGKLAFQLSYGDFINTRKLYPQDFRHFNGNKTIFSQFRLDDFRNLEYYQFSTTHSYFEGHAEYNLGGFILNKIPLLRKLKLQEVVTVHLLDTKEFNRFVEVTAGVEKLKLFRFEVVSSFANGRRGAIGFVFGIKRIIG